MDAPLIVSPIEPRWKSSLSFLSGCLVNLVPLPQATGSINAFGTFSVYFTSYYFQSHPNNLFVRDGFFIVFPIANAVEGICFGIGTLLYFKIGIRLTHLIGGSLYVGAFLLAGFIENPYTFGLLFSILYGAGAGISSYPSVLAAWEFFPNAKGRVSGLIAACYGISPTFFGLIFTFLANPANVTPDKTVSNGEVSYKIFGEDVAGRVQMASLIIAGIYATQFLIAIAIAQRPKTKSILGLKASLAAGGSVLSHQHEAEECHSLSTAIRTVAFWNLTVTMFSSLIYGLFLLNVYKNYGMLSHPNDHWLSSIGSFSALLSCIGRIGVAGAMDFISFRLAFGVTMAIQLALSATITLVAQGSIYIYGLWVALSVTAFSGIFSSIGYESTKIFGPIMGSYVFAIIGQSLTLASLATIVLNEVIGGRFGYAWTFHACACFSFLALLLTLLLREHH